MSLVFQLLNGNIGNDLKNQRALLWPVEQPPTGLTQPDRKAADQANESGAFAGRQDTSIQSANAPRATDDPPGSVFTIATADPGTARAAIDSGARGVLVAVTDDFAPAERMAVALSVTEANLGLADGTLALILEIAGPAAALRLARGVPASRRLCAIGIDLDGFGGRSTGVVDGPRLVAAGLVALAGTALRLPTYLAGAGSLSPSGLPAIAGFTHALVDADEAAG